MKRAKLNDAALAERRERAALAAQDEQKLLAAAWDAFNRGLDVPTPDPAPHLPTLVAERPSASGPGDTFRFAPPPAERDRLVIQNWKTEAGLVPIGDVQLELEPGQAVTLWVNRNTPTPIADTGDETPRGSLAILWDDEELLA